ncbi:MAG: hypothetical protein KKB70_03710 [Proteobacteria bacterium]|nr:hypothetical protein [Pseudomonadota bacterium]MBU1612332.1 hypothetical protein [Pseudomonadota bacterium]
MEALREDKLLGQEFLTWLWHRIDTTGGNFTTRDNQEFGLAMMESVSVQGGEGDIIATATVKSPSGELTEAKSGLKTGKKVSRAQLKFSIDQDDWVLTLKADDLGLSGLKTPKVDLKEEEGDDPDGKFLEKMYLLEKCLEMLDIVYSEYVHLRLSPKWQDSAQAIRTWIEKQ